MSTTKKIDTKVEISQTIEPNQTPKVIKQNIVYNGFITLQEVNKQKLHLLKNRIQCFYHLHLNNLTNIIT